MNKICTTIKQSKKLIELGIDRNTADMYYSCGAVAPDVMTSSKQDYKCYTVCWSLSALLVLFDDKAGLAKEYESWFAYDNGKSHCTKHYDNPLDAAFEMVVWLKENNKI